MERLTPGCPRCREPLDGLAGPDCPGHGVGPVLWRAGEPTYDAFVEHLATARDFPTYLPWPMAPGWMVSDFAVVTDPSGVPLATLTGVSGTSELDGPVDVLLVAEEPGVGLGARCAGLRAADPGHELGDQQPVVRVRIGSLTTALWPVSVSGVADSAELDRTVLAGEAAGRWLWVVLRPAPAVLLMRDDWILRDVSGGGPLVLEMAFGGPNQAW